MMHPSVMATQFPDKPAYRMAESGQTITFNVLEAGSNQGAHLFRKLGLKRGDHIAILLENHPCFLQICLAAMRSGLYFTTISYRLQETEVEYIVNDCGAQIFITSKDRQPVVEKLVGKMPKVAYCYMLDGVIAGFESWQLATSTQPTSPIDDESTGAAMLYSSGTTGRPKGVLKPLPEGVFGADDDSNLLATLYAVNGSSIYLSPAPLYHAAPLNFTLGLILSGVTCVIMAHFEAEAALKTIEKYRITHSQWVPTMFIRMLKLNAEVRLQYDISSLQVAIHSAAPCPVQIKEAMINWWGPVLHEYYAGTEGNGFVAINSEEWLAHKGSVGRALMAQLHIVGEDGEEVTTSEVGTIYFEGGGEFTYHNDQEKTAQSGHPKGWTTLGDVGYVDAEGYLYLTDRKSFMIISGGVNIYPQEAENVLVTHPKVVDVAVFGVPNKEFGEEVKAVVQPKSFADAGPELAEELISHCRSQISHIKCPKSVDFEEELPRHPTGKLYKRLLKDKYWQGHHKRVAG